MVGASFTVLELSITRAYPTALQAKNGGHTANSGLKPHRQMEYQILNQFGGALKEVYSYTNASGNVVDVRVVHLKVSEQLVTVTKDPPTVPDPIAARNQGVSDSGAFTDTHELQNGAEFDVTQFIFVHILDWQGNNAGFGDRIALLTIKEAPETAPEKVKTYAGPQEIPEGP